MPASDEVAAWLDLAEYRQGVIRQCAGPTSKADDAQDCQDLREVGIPPSRWLHQRSGY